MNNFYQTYVIPDVQCRVLKYGLTSKSKIDEIDSNINSLTRVLTFEKNLESVYLLREKMKKINKVKEITLYQLFEFLCKIFQVNVDL